jgi:purine-binding chemotaxis protein CheW
MSTATTAAKQDFEELLQLVGFKLENEEYGVDILRVKEIIKMIKLTPIPSAPDYIEGVINLRGKIIPVVDIRRKMGMNKKEIDKNSRIIVVELNDKTLGFIVDEVSEVLRIPKSITEPPPSEFASGIDQNFITSIAKLEERLLILLDLERALAN